MQKHPIGDFYEDALRGRSSLSSLRPYRYRRNVITIKKYGVGDTQFLKICDLRSCREAGQGTDEAYEDMRRLDCEIKRASGLLGRALGLDDSDLDGVDGKLKESIIRARSKVFELAICNSWELFITGTLDEKKYNRYDLDAFHKGFSRFIKNLNEHRAQKIKYLIVPETHKDGAWHFHGFVMGLNADDLTPFKLGDTMGLHIAQKVCAGETIYNWPAYADKFGFCDLEPIRSLEAVSKYVTKYISKSLGEDITESGAHLYYRSRGLSGAVEVARVYGDEFSEDVPLYCGSFVLRRELLAALGEPDFIGQHGNIWWIPADSLQE